MLARPSRGVKELVPRSGRINVQVLHSAIGERAKNNAWFLRSAKSRRVPLLAFAPDPFAASPIS